MGTPFGFDRYPHTRSILRLLGYKFIFEWVHNELAAYSASLSLVYGVSPRFALRNLEILSEPHRAALTLVSSQLVHHSNGKSGCMQLSTYMRRAMF